jgi:FixJ family two-component response regulator
MAIKPSPRLLIVIHNDETLRMIGKPSLESAGYDLLICQTPDEALAHALAFQPHVLLLDHDMAGLSGRDLMLALHAEGIQAPAVELMSKGDPEDIVQSYRVGVREVILKPFRETELFTVIEQVMDEVREDSEREALAEQLREANYRLELTAREMKALVDIQNVLHTSRSEFDAVDQVLAILMTATDSNRGWVVLESFETQQFLLAASRNMPQNVTAALHKQWMDKLSTRVFESGEAWVAGESDLRAVNLERLGALVMVTPIKVQNRLIGTIALAKRGKIDYSKNMHQLVQTACHFTAMFLLSNRLFSGLRARNQQIEQTRTEAREALSAQLLPLIQDSIIALSHFSAARMLTLNQYERGAVKNVRFALQRMRTLLGKK